MKKQSWTESKQSSHLFKTKSVTRVGFLLLISFLVSCQTNPKKSNKDVHANSGTWQGLVNIKDKVKNRSHTLKFKAIAQQFSNLRLDVTSSLAGHIASVGVTKEALTYLVPRERKYYSGGLSSQQMKSVLPFEVDPRILFYVFWDKPISGKDWKCKSLTETQRACFSKSMGTMVKWVGAGDGEKVVKVDHRRGALHFKITKFRAHLSDQQKKRFIIKNPGW